MDMNKLLYLLFFIGVGLWQYSVLYWLFTSVKNRIFIGRNLKKLTDCEELSQYGKVSWHLKMVIEGAEGEKFFPTVSSFYFASGVLAAGITLVLSFVMTLKAALLCSTLVATLPYFLLQARLYDRRVSRSKEGDLLIQELLNNYRIFDFNMKEAIEQTAATLEEAPMGKRLLLHLAKGIQTVVTKKEVEDLLSGFRYALDTAWGNVLASNIFFGYMYGIRVDTALEDLLLCMTQSRQVVEYGKRENNEARLMLVYLAPISFLLSIFCACHYFDFTLRKFMQYQFATALGLKWFMMMTICYILGILMQRFFAKEKMDI